MNWLDASNSLESLAVVNDRHTDRHVQPVRGERGGWLVGADLLSDCGPGCYWHDYRQWLESLRPTDESPAAPQPEE